MPILIAIDIFIKNVFKTYASKRYIQFSLHHHPTTQYFLHPSKESSFRQRDQFAHGGEAIDATFKGKGTFFVSECLRQRRLEKLCEMFESFVFCMINATTLTERFHCYEKIIMFIGLSVICLSFTILNTFENKKGVIKTLVYSSVIDINQIGLMFCSIIITGGQERFAQGASRVLIRSLQISLQTKCGIYSLFTGKCNVSVAPGWGICPLFLLMPHRGVFRRIAGPHLGAFVVFPKQNDKCARGWALLELTKRLLTKHEVKMA